MDGRVETWEAFVKLAQEKGRGIVSKTNTMDQSLMSMQTPETKSQLMQWLKGYT
jgi:hypothetical protein